MSNLDRIQKFQEALAALDLDGWLFFDHHMRDPLAYRVLGFQPKQSVSRRWYYLVPRLGEPHSLVHRIESKVLDDLPGQKHVYSGWRAHQDGLGALLFGLKRIAMQYSPGCAIPYVSMVDGGTLEFVRSFGVEVVSSADLIQSFDAVLSATQVESHLSAGRKMDEIRAAAFAKVGDALREGVSLNEWALHSWMREQFDREGLITDHGPIVAVNEHAADPHYEPSPEASAVIRSGDLLLVDMWAKWNKPGAIYYDITWTAFCGADPPSEMDKVFEIVKEARDAAAGFVESSLAGGRMIHGFEVDNSCRRIIDAAGFGEYFVHRTGHSIGEEVHGTGANMDDMETHDERRILANTLFSVEPGIYLDHFGIRSEFNVLAEEAGARVTGEVQQSLLRLLP
jgi:Xaa-Pro aminopeptidase